MNHNWLRLGLRTSFGNCFGNCLRNRFDFLGGNFLNLSCRGFALRLFGNLLRNGFPFIGKVHFLTDDVCMSFLRLRLGLRERNFEFSRPGRNAARLGFGGGGRNFSSRSVFAKRAIDSYLFLGRRGWRDGTASGGGGNSSSRKPSRFLESLPQFAKPLGIDRIVPLDVNLFQLRRQFGCATVVARSEIQVEKPFECGCVPRRALEDALKQMCCLLRQAIA